MGKKKSAFFLAVSFFLSSGSAVSGIAEFDGHLFTEKFYNSSPSYVYQFGTSIIADSEGNALTNLSVTASSASSTQTYILKTDDPSWPHKIDGYYYNNVEVDTSNRLNQLTITATNGADTETALTNILATSDQKVLGEAKNITVTGGNSLTPTITWSPIVDADNYIVRLYDTPDLPNIKSWYLDSTTLSIEGGLLEDGKSYTLRVIANDREADIGIINRSSTYIPLNFADIQNLSGETLINNTTLINSGLLKNEGGIAGQGTYLQTDGQTVNNGSIVQESINIQNGSFVANGSITVTDKFYNYGFLSGEGVINGDVLNNGSLAPGASPGKLDIVGEYIQSDEGKLEIEIGGYGQGVDYDWLNITGSAKLAGKLDIFFYDDFVPEIGDSFTFLTTTTGQIFGMFGSYSWPTGMHSWAINYSPNSVYLTYQGKAPVPEPATMVLFGAGLAGLAAVGRRRKA